MRKTLLALGVAGLGSLLAVPAFAQTYASGSSTIVLMNGASQSVGAEISLPTGTYFTGGVSATLGTVAGAAVVTPTLETPGDPSLVGESGLAINDQNFAELVVDPGLPDSVAGLGGGSTTFTAAAAAQLDSLDLTTNPADLASVVSIIRAGAGVDGLE
ncbi:hypothetical protein [Cyanobacterium sp. Dongsha4]|uniref:hypothetical protein n=1 Tax=Cyanobacterium sp. DS4 TaxID=2878255 RepID=UPI002E820880|nr:hypothetical protein [Cyanobacterium sp. Dongsha4]WVK99372.1 hypothetical protein Dongsha4_11850 [Cyanobacterium sp. Dongsha4]